MSYSELSELCNKLNFRNEQCEEMAKTWFDLCKNQLVIKDRQNPSQEDKALMTFLDLEMSYASNLHQQIMQIAQYVMGLDERVKFLCVQGDDDALNLSVLSNQLDLCKAMMTTNISMGDSQYQHISNFYRDLMDGYEKDESQQICMFIAFMSGLETLKDYAENMRTAMGLSGDECLGSFLPVDVTRVASNINEAEKLLAKYGIEAPSVSMTEKAPGEE